MALGLIPIYNHSYKSNCEYFMDFEDENMMIKTVRVIEKGRNLPLIITETGMMLTKYGLM